MNDTIVKYMKDNNLAEVMRGCLALLDMQHPDNPKIAYLHNTNLRSHIQTVYNAQPLLKDHERISIAAIAGAVHGLLVEGKSAATILLVPGVDLIALASKSEKESTPRDQDLV